MSATPLQFMALCFMAGLFLTLYFYIQRRKRNPLNLPYPPGPKGVPVLGNLFDIPTSGYIYKTFRQWGRELGTPAIKSSLSADKL